jgi:hypothetical protein
VCLGGVEYGGQLGEGEGAEVLLLELVGQVLAVVEEAVVQQVDHVQQTAERRRQLALRGRLARRDPLRLPGVKGRVATPGVTSLLGTKLPFLEAERTAFR